MSFFHGYGRAITQPLAAESVTDGSLELFVCTPVIHTVRDHFHTLSFPLHRPDPRQKLHTSSLLLLFTAICTPLTTSRQILHGRY